VLGRRRKVRFSRMYPRIWTFRNRPKLRPISCYVLPIAAKRRCAQNEPDEIRLPPHAGFVEQSREMGLHRRDPDVVTISVGLQGLSFSQRSQKPHLSGRDPVFVGHETLIDVFW